MNGMDDLAPLRETELSAALAKLEALLALGRRAFLLGAGCSKCAGLPLTAELTAKVLVGDKLDAKSKHLLSAVQSGFSGATQPNIEDYLSELVDLLAIADRRAFRGAAVSSVSIDGVTYQQDELRCAVEQIKRGIDEVINVKVSTDWHRRFVRHLHKPTRPGKVANWQTVDYLVLNYDTLIEDSLALERAPFADGLEGGVTGWWSPTVFDRSDVVARVFKLHGSINWSELPDDPLPRRFGASVDLSEGDSRKIVIWPASTKYRETQLDPYAQLLERSRKALLPELGKQLVLVMCGYSFRDAHINIEIDRALRASCGELTVIAFTDDESPTGKLLEWNKDELTSDQVLIYGRRGFFHGATTVRSEVDLPWWKFENLVRLLEGER